MDDIQKAITVIVVFLFFAFLIDGYIKQKKEQDAFEQRYAERKECEEIWKRNNPQSNFDVCQFPSTARAIVRDHRKGVYK